MIGNFHDCMTAKKTSGEPTVASFATPQDWSAWLAEHHAEPEGVWMRISKKGASVLTITYQQALDEALAWGWIDGQKKPIDAEFWMQRFTPRRPKSIWSVVNRNKALALISQGRMTPAGLREIERATADGRWDKAYESQSTATEPADLLAALAQNPKAALFYRALNRVNRYAIIFRLQNVKKAETRARKLSQFVEMLAREERIYP